MVSLRYRGDYQSLRSHRARGLVTGMGLFLNRGAFDAIFEKKKWDQGKQVVYVAFFSVLVWEIKVLENIYQRKRERKG